MGDSTQLNPPSPPPPTSQPSSFWVSVQVLSLGCFIYSVFSMILETNLECDCIIIVAALAFSYLTSAVFYKLLLSIASFFKDIWTNEKWIVALSAITITKGVLGKTPLKWIIMGSSLATAVLSSLKSQYTEDPSGLSEAFSLCVLEVAVHETVQGRVCEALVSFFFFCIMVGAIIRAR
ncbi:hypothetical protein HHK36_005269 [Tetracentron sinense]|uniref:Uncharacterized protein n=1 Tax=Tetracentron sinense TaxID=13715 RepID=A0A834ZP55_TETSI|nr:hypothetical protein HHK36_005269 [Tetracentron sinense]